MPPLALSEDHFPIILMIKIIQLWTTPESELVDQQTCLRLLLESTLPPEGFSILWRCRPYTLIYLTGKTGTTVKRAFRTHLHLWPTFPRPFPGLQHPTYRPFSRPSHSSVVLMGNLELDWTDRGRKAFPKYGLVEQMNALLGPQNT